MADKTHIHCSYCGGCNIELVVSPKGEVPHIHHLILTAPDYGVKKAFNLTICVWCWKKVFDSILGQPIPNEVTTQA